MSSVEKSGEQLILVDFVFFEKKVEYTVLLDSDKLLLVLGKIMIVLYNSVC